MLASMLLSLAANDARPIGPVTEKPSMGNTRNIKEDI